jgi:predicted Zn-dependent protease with MMP-like domain
MDHVRLSAIARQVVTRAQAKLPPDIRPLAENVPVTLEPAPGDAVLEEGWEPDILGLFVGHAHHGEHTELEPLPPQIVLFLGNLWDYSGEDEDTYRDEVRLTYLHELGHYLGWDEDDLTARGLE